MWIDAIIMPSEEPAPYRPSCRPDRSQVHAKALTESYQFRTAVLDYLNSHQLMDAVRWVSEPGSLPMVTLSCQQQVLERLQQAPQFEAGRSLGLSFTP
ncbi:hypothetical protein SAMN05444354_12446 [Stigmatella aurantiaca]|uniref:Uncharacterized protein n=1 Tax=Stigmatella aurantiaca TaxID=41 RepID=A0A1H8BR22_STIAU|nr:hypothetical protein [Stigmatella aurantiaca]SEM84468.1 hypothetical protein SAMN05444354_12446 [Stigmatella aurantiaca]